MNQNNNLMQPHYSTAPTKPVLLCGSSVIVSNLLFNLDLGESLAPGRLVKLAFDRSQFRIFVQFHDQHAVQSGRSCDIRVDPHGEHGRRVADWLRRSLRCCRDSSLARHAWQ